MTKKTIIPLVLSILALSVTIIGVTMELSHSTKVSTKQEQPETRKDTKEKAYQILLEQAGYQEQDLEFIEKQDANKYKFLNKKDSTETKKVYYIVNTQKNSYEMLTSSVRSG